MPCDAAGENWEFSCCARWVRWCLRRRALGPGTAPMRQAMIRAAARALACLLAAASGVGWGADPGDADSARAREVRCEVRTVWVRASDPADAKLACEGAADAIGFLAAQGLDVSGDVAIHVVQRLPAVAGASAAGCYLDSERRVVVLNFAEFARLKTWLNLPADARMYRSLATHEVAHALGACNFKVRAPSIQAKEYIAYVTQLETMEPALRKQIMSNFKCKAFEVDWQMSSTIYMFDCMGFGVRAYLHFQNLANRREYLQSILNGKALVE